METSQAASGDMVIGATPMPAETSDTARLRWVSNQPVTQAISGAKIADVAAPTNSPNTSWNWMSDVARLARAMLAASSTDPISTTGRAPMRSASVPQAMLPNAIARNAIVIALEMPATDHPVSSEMGRRKTGSENIEPTATQLSRPPAATMTQRYCVLRM